MLDIDFNHIKLRGSATKDNNSVLFLSALALYMTVTVIGRESKPK